MVKQNKTKKKNIVLYIFTTIFLIAVVVGIVFACTSILKMQKDYLIFVVSDKQNGDVIKSSNNNIMNFDNMYTFDIKYIFSEKENNKKIYDYSVNITGCQNISLYKGEYPVQFNKLDLSKSFKLEKKDTQFTISIPPAEKFFEIIFSEYLDDDKKNLYFFDLCESDYFSLNIMSYNGKDSISYKFHLSNKKGENVNIEEIISNNNELFFNSIDKIYYPVEEIEISDETIIFDGGKHD